MLYYIIPSLLWLLFCIWKAWHCPQLHLSDYIFTLPLVLLVVLRGDVGADTPVYIAHAQGIIWWNEDRTIGVEFGYTLLVRFVAMFTTDPHVVVAVMSLLDAVLFFLALYMWENGQCIVSLVLIPLCYFYYTMDILRVGIAFPLAAIAVLRLEKQRYAQFYVLALVSICIQMTAVILLPMLVLARRGAELPLKKAAYVMVAGALILCSVFYFFADMIAARFVMYAIDPTLDSNRSTGPLIISVICSIVAIWFCERRYRYLGIIFLAIEVTFFKIAQLSIGGNRLQSMALFAQFLALSYCAKRPLNRGQLTVVVLLFCLASSYVARNFLEIVGDPASFIPYHFAWDK
jgi:hypothetical protein